MARGNKVQSVEKAIKILDILMESAKPLSLAEISEVAQWPKSTVHALLSTMRDSSLVEQDPSDGKYRLGYHLFELGSRACNSWEAVKYAHSPMLHIAAKMHSSVYLARLIGDKLLLTACEEPNEGFRVYDELGAAIPLHCTSQGKVILAYRPAAEVKYLLENADMKAYTENTITDAAQFTAALPGIREDGYALEKGEYVSGLYSYAAPIFSRDGTCEYALASAGPYQVMESFGRKQEALRDELLRAAGEISEMMGYKG